MPMGNRPKVATAPLPITVLDITLLAQQLVCGLVRIPFRHPFSGRSTLLRNLAASATREIVRSFMGYSLSLSIPEFRSLELAINGVCEWIMPPLVGSMNVLSRPMNIGGVPGFLYLPRDERVTGVILYLHGGGYIGTSPLMYGFFTAILSRETHCAVFVADYRLAPEFPFPAATEDASDIYHALVELGIPSDRIFIAGDSGGGGLANILLLASAEQDDPVCPAGLVLFSPEIDLALSGRSMAENAELDILPWNIPTSSCLHGAGAKDRSVSPLTADLRSFPPVCVSWGGDEMFRDSIRCFADRLRDAEVRVDAEECVGMFHVFPILMPWSTESKTVLHKVSAFTQHLTNQAAPLEGDIRDKLGIAPDRRPRRAQASRIVI